ncbi:MAG: hypothetical protein P1V18_01925 [Candidatus Gracilibacteria bacterium]|nr:hypothetical protein [Candidatus Gracilibacteria bacterium]
MKLTEYAQQCDTAAEVIERSESIAGKDVVKRLKEQAKSIRNGVTKTIQATGINPDSHNQIEDLPDDRAGDCHMGTKRVRVDLDKAGTDSDHLIIHENIHLINARRNRGVRVMNTDLEEGITDGAAEKITGKDITYSDEKGFADEVADANGVNIIQLHDAYINGDNDQINTWYFFHLAKQSA